MSIHFFTEKVTFSLKHKNKLKKWINQVCLNEKMVIGNLNIVFTSNERILEINSQFLNHYYFTDIITFNSNTERLIGGDIFISIDTVNENSVIYGSTLIDELYRVIIHGVLHLLGYDDKTEKQKKMMRIMENVALKSLYENFLHG